MAVALASQLREGTKKSHTMAENTGFVSCFLKGVVDKASYRKLVADLYFVYGAMEEEIAKLIDRAPEAEERVIARRLFARVLDAPGGINILTIHAFCQALLKRFPLEAGVAPGFEVLDEGEAGTILKQAQNEQMAALARRDAPPRLRDALAAVAGRISIVEYDEMMKKLLGERAWLLSRIDGDAGLARERQRLASSLGVSPDATAGALISALCADSAFDGHGLRQAARALAEEPMPAAETLAREALTAEALRDRPELVAGRLDTDAGRRMVLAEAA